MEQQKGALISAAVLLILGGSALSCKPKTRTAVAQPPVTQAPRPPEVQIASLPEPASNPLVKKTEPKPSFDPTEEVIRKSEARFREGEKNLKAGFLEKAKRDFDAALEIVLRSGIEVSRFEKLESHYESLIDRIFHHELTALKEGDGFTEERYESAPIDEIASGQLPSTFDPNSRRLAEESLQQIPHDIPLPLNDAVLRYVDYFQGRGRKTMEAGMQRAGRYRSMISRVLAEEGVPQDLIYLCQAESGFRPLAYSRAKCKGLWQFASFRGAEYGLKQNWWVDERSDPEKSTRAAARHLRDLYQQFGDWLLAMAAYNTGPGNIERAIERTGYADYWELLKRRTLHPETQNYIPIIIAMAIISKDPLKYGFEVEPDPSLETEAVTLETAVELRTVAQILEIPLQEIKELNPHIRRLVTPRRDPDFNLYVPSGSKDKLLASLGDMPEEIQVTRRTHRIEEGETLHEIARKYGTTAEAIAQVNGISSPRTIQPGDALSIPVTGEAAVNEIESDGPVRYAVRRGDTLSGIAREFDVSVVQIRKWNKLRTGRGLRVGQVLTIYPGGDARAGGTRTIASKSSSNSGSRGTQRIVHRVKKGDTLYAIASDYKTSVDSIVTWNNISKKDTLRVGDRLTIYLNP
ncbi:MAG: LysM peptidoglycan-binding domain-containing protein [Acidobacteriota bacterium]